MQYILLAILILFLLINVSLASFLFLQAISAEKKSRAWWGHIIMASVLAANTLVFLILFATKSLQAWT